MSTIHTDSPAKLSIYLYLCKYLLLFSSKIWIFKKNVLSLQREAQEVVTAGMVLRNGVVETRKRAKIVRGDVIEFEGNRIEVI